MSRNKNKFISIKKKLTVTVFLILFVVLSFQFLANYLFAETFYINSKKKKMDNAYSQILKAAQESDENIVDIMDEYEDYNSIQFIIANEDLKVIYNSKQYSMSNSKNKYKITSDFNFKKNLHLFRRDAATKVAKKKNVKKDRLILHGIIDRGERQYYIVIRSYVEGIRQDMQSTNLFIMIVSAFALVIGGIFVYVFAGRISKPIKEVDQVASHVSELDFSLRAATPKSENELSRLARNINTMADRLEKNLTDLMEANKKLEAENEYKNKIDEIRKDFVSNVSHELKTPLAILTGYAEMLKTDVEGVDKDYYYDVILDESNRMTSLVTNLLDLSQMEHGLATLSMDTVNLTETISNVISKFELFFHEKGIIYRFNSPEHYYVKGNVLYLEQAVNNYIVNAINHTASGDNIDIKLSREKDQIVFTVFNEGGQIDDNDADKIWESFYRSDQARTRGDDNNRGLGLYIVSSIINAHHGQYGYENLETGVSFWFKIKEDADI